MSASRADERPSTSHTLGPALDPVTFEVLKNSFSSIVDQMAEQVLRTCYSFVIYVKDFSSALCDRHGNTVMQGSHDIAVHVGTLHFSAKAILELYGGELAPGDVYVMNDPYIGGTHFNDVRLVRPVFYEEQLIAMVQCNGHWSDIGGSVPGSHDVTAREHFEEGLRITPTKLWDKGVLREDVLKLIVSNTRTPVDCEGDLHAQAEATALAERELLRLVDKYGRDTVLEAMEETQRYVERLVRSRIAELPDGEWDTMDFVDFDPGANEEGLVPVKVRMAIEGDELRYDLSGSAPAMASALNCCFGMSFSAVVAGTKTFFPEVPLNSGFYRALSVDVGPEGTVVNAGYPIAVTGFNAGVYEKLANATYELWSRIMPDRALACAYNLDYLVVGGHDGRFDETQPFMWYDWNQGGWGGRNGKDGLNAAGPVFGPGLQSQPVEGQERINPVLTTALEFITDSGGPGRFRGGIGVRKGGALRGATRTVMSYSCDRARSVTWGLAGGLPSIPSGVWVNAGSDGEQYLGAWFAKQRLADDACFERWSAGGGGCGDPLTREAAAVREDVVDGYVSLERARKDYGVVLTLIDEELELYEVDVDGTKAERRRIARERVTWLRTDPETVAARYRRNEIDVMDAVRQYAVILDWGTGELLPESTRVFRMMFERRAAETWKELAAASA